MSFAEEGREERATTITNGRETDSETSAQGAAKGRQKEFDRFFCFWDSLGHFLATIEVGTP